MRGRIATSAGLWPAWWTLGNSGEWPSNGEVDIMEFYNGRILANVACGTSTRYQAKWDSVTKTITSFNDPTVVVEVPRLADGLGRHEDRPLRRRRAR